MRGRARVLLMIFRITTSRKAPARTLIAANRSGGQSLMAVFITTQMSGLWERLSGLLTPTRIGQFAIASVVMFVFLSVLAMVVLVILPSHYLVRISEDARNGVSPEFGQRILGAVLVVLGLFLSLPGVPGPGIVLVVLGFVLVGVIDPRRFVRFLLRHPDLLDRIDRIRTCFGKLPLIRPS
jgi:hypothetical protein